MQKIKTFLFMIMIIALCGSKLFAQNVFWVESAFDSPRLVKTAADGSELLSKSLPAGTLPQSITFNANGTSLFWSGLSFNNAQINKTSSTLTTLSVVVDSQSVLRGITLDTQNNKLYWISTNLINGPKIWRADLNGQSPTVLIDFGPASDNTPRSISLDIDAGKMYWTNFGEGKIQRTDMTVGALPEDIITGLNGPSGLAVDADSGKIFWTEVNSHQIKSADLSGTNVTLLIDGLSYPNSISVNRQLNRMAWTEMGYGKIKSAALDGSDIFEYNVAAVAPTGIVIEAPTDTSIVPSGELVITPPDTTIQVHNYVQYNAQLVDSQNVHYEIDATWDVKIDRVGPILNNGSLFAYFPGEANVMAKYDTVTAKASLTVVDTTSDSSGANEIKLVRVFPNGKEKNPKTIKEGETYKLGGLPHPFNIINGFGLFFPKSSLHEDITIKIKLPRLATISRDSVGFINRIVNAIQLDVFVKDSLISPYYFDKPISIAIPFKRGILKQFGINPEHLGMFYAIDSVNFDTLGLSHVMVDSSTNLIYGLAEHFSTLAVREKSSVTSDQSDIKNDFTPESFVLKQNYPNPFNPTTTISYQIPKNSEVKLSVYNALGQKVASLISEKQAAGTYNVEWNASGFASGIYLYRLETDQGFTQTKKLILLK